MEPTKTLAEFRLQAEHINPRTIMAWAIQNGLAKLPVAQPPPPKPEKRAYHRWPNKKAREHAQNLNAKIRRIMVSL